MSGVTSPSIASGTAIRLYTTESHRFSTISFRALAAMRTASATGASFSPRKTASAWACAIWAAEIGEIDTCAAASAGASLRPSPTISGRAALALQRLEPGDLVGRLQGRFVARDAELARDQRDGGLAIARQDLDLMSSLELRDDLFSVGAQGLPDGEHHRAFPAS